MTLRELAEGIGAGAATLAGLFVALAVLRLFLRRRRQARRNRETLASFGRGGEDDRGG